MNKLVNWPRLSFVVVEIRIANFRGDRRPNEAEIAPPGQTVTCSNQSHDSISAWRQAGLVPRRRRSRDSCEPDDGDDDNGDGSDQQQQHSPSTASIAPPKSDCHEPELHHRLSIIFFSLDYIPCSTTSMDSSFLP